MIKKYKMLSTPFYRTLVKRHSIGCDDEPDFTYGPYDIFCMETRLYPVVYDMLGRDVELIFKTVSEDDRMNLKIFINRVVANDPLKDPMFSTNQILDIDEELLSELQRELDRILGEYKGYCVIDKHELYLSSNKHYSESWFFSVLDMVEISTEYNPFIKYNAIYLAFNPMGDYKSAYNMVISDILKTVDKYYEVGVVYRGNDIAEKWNLVPLDYSEEDPRYYSAVWSDKRFAPNITDFLISKLHGDPYIRIKVSDNLIIRHNISTILSENNIGFVFENDYIKLVVDNLEHAQYLTALVMSGYKYNKSGDKIVTYGSDRLAEVYLYQDIVSKTSPKLKTTVYRTDNIDKPYRFSLLLTNDMSSDMVFSLLNQYKEKELEKISLDHNSNEPYKILEKEYHL